MTPHTKTNYGGCPRKRRARELSIITGYRAVTGLRSIPLGSHYWTLCGPMAKKDGPGLQASCELNHVLEAGLLQNVAQFHGVEKKDDYYAANVQALTDVYGRPRHSERQVTWRDGPTLYHGEIHTVLSDALHRGELRPAIVNLDTIYEPKRAASLLGRVLNTLNHCEGPIFVVLNAVIDNPRRGRRYSTAKLMDAIVADEWCHTRIQEFGWLDSSQAVEYNGTGVSSTKMSTVAFYLPFRKAALAG